MPHAAAPRPPERVGILMLDTRFPRPPGDIGHPESFRRLGIEPLYRIVAGASARRVVEQGDPTLLEPFVEAGLELIALGAQRIGTSCGFLARFQGELEARLPVPVLSSALLACEQVAAPGILTFSAESLDSDLLAAARVPHGTPVQGVEPDGEFHQRIIRDEPAMDFGRAEREVVAAAITLIERHPDVRTLVLECTNMPVYRTAIEQSTGRQTIDVVRMLSAGRAWPQAARHYTEAGG